MRILLWLSLLGRRWQPARLSRLLEVRKFGAAVKLRASACQPSLSAGGCDQLASMTVKN
jgi:hypothetical protein